MEESGTRWWHSAELLKDEKEWWHQGMAGDESQAPDECPDTSHLLRERH